MNKRPLPLHDVVLPSSVSERFHNRTLVQHRTKSERPTSPLILIVTGEDNLRLLLEKSMQIANYRTISVASHMEAAAILAQQPVDILLLDILPTTTEDFRSCQYLRQRSDVPVIVLSTMGSQRMQTLAIQSGASAYIIKPVRLADLHHCLQRFL